MSNSNIQAMTETAQRCFEAANTIIESMAVGERKQIKELAAAVGTAVGLEPKKVLGFVNHFAHETNIAFVTRGKKGGIIRGTKPVKVVKVKKVKKATVATTTTTIDSDQ